MDKQKNTSEFSNNISADDLLKKLKENIDSVADDDEDDTDESLSNDGAVSADTADVDADNADISTSAEAEETTASESESAFEPDNASKSEKPSNKPLQIQHRYKFRRSTRIKKAEPSVSRNDTDDIRNAADSDSHDEAPAALGAALGDSSDRAGMSDTARAILNDMALDSEDASDSDGSAANSTEKDDFDDGIDDIDDIDEASAEKIENLMKKYMSEDEYSEYLSDGVKASGQAKSGSDSEEHAEDDDVPDGTAAEVSDADSDNAQDSTQTEGESISDAIYTDEHSDNADKTDGNADESAVSSDSQADENAVTEVQAEHTDDSEYIDISEMTDESDSENTAKPDDETEPVYDSADEAPAVSADSDGEDDGLSISADELESVSDDTAAETADDPTEKETASEGAAGDASDDADNVAADNGEENSLGDIFNEDFDETDANLMLAFGMEDELEKSIGKENVEKISENLDRQNEQIETENSAKEKKKKKVKEEKPKAEEFEYTAFNQTKEILGGFKTKYKNATYRMLAVAAFAILLFFFENIGIFGGSLPEAFDSGVYPVVHIMLDFQLLLLCLVPVYQLLLDGFKALVSLKPNVNSLLSVVVSVSVIYTVVMCFISTGMEFRMYSFPVAMCVLLALINERLNLQREVYSFNVVSSRRPKYVLDKLSLDQSDLEKEAFYNVLPENPSIFKIEKTSFVNGFFRRTGEYSKNKVVISAVIPASIVISILTFIVALFVMKSASSAFFAAYLTFMLCMPFSMLLTYSLPCCKASKDAYRDESAFVGESALDEYTTASSISFDDKDVFPAGGVKVKSVKVFGNNRIDYVIYNVASVFSALGGPLSSVLDIATMDMGKSDKVELLDISNDGIEALVDGAHMLVGKANYLRKNRFVPISDPDDEEIESTGGISIMYLVNGDEIAAKIYVEYHIDPDFEYILKKMYKSGICVGIKTVDPNIDDEMLGRIIRLEKYPVRVLKCRETFDDSTSKEGIDSGIVSKRSTKALLKTFTLCDKVQHITKANIIINAFAALIGIIISAFVIWLNIASGVFSIYVFMYQLFWILPIYVTSRLFI